jgi:hypothetical protein
LSLPILGFAVCELRKALILKGTALGGKTPKAEVAGVPFFARVDRDFGSAF